MARSISPILTLTLLVLLLSTLVLVVKAPVKTVETTTERSEYFVGETVQAMIVVTYTGPQPSTEVKFEWFDPNGSEIFNETKNLTFYPADGYGAAFSNWTVTTVGNNYSVRGIHLGTMIFSEARFNVSTYQESVVVKSLSITLSRPFYENNTVARATATVGYLGNGTELRNISFEWTYPNGTRAFQENVSSPTGGQNGTIQVNSTWTVDLVGAGYRVQATYSGIQPLSDTAFFDVIPLRVRTWHNTSISGDVIWTKTDSPFGVCSNITIEEGAKLTVEAGSVIRFCPQTGVSVRGTLVMDGLPASPINLTSYSYPAAQGDWRGLVFQDESKDAGSLLKNVIIEYSQTGLKLNMASPLIANVSISNSTISGMETYWTNISLSGLSIIDSGRGIYVSHTTLLLMVSEISRCDDGIVMEDSYGTIRNSSIHHNRERGIWAIRSSITIGESLITGNSNKAVRIEESQSVLIENTTISYSNFTFDVFQSIGLAIRECQMMNASSVGLSFWTTDDVLIENSTIENSATSLRVAGGSTVRTLNSTFDQTGVVVTGGSRLYVDNYLHIHTMDDNGSALGGVSITLSLDGAPATIGSTGEDGWFKWYIVRHATYSGLPDDPRVTWVYLEVDLDNYNFTNNPRNVNMFTSHTEDFIGHLVPTPGNGGEISWYPPLLIIVVLATAVGLPLIALMFLKHQKTEKEAPAFDIEEGKVYLVTRGGTQRTFERFVSEIEKGTKGLCFTRTYPRTLKKQYDMGDAKVIWLSRDVDKGGLLPTNLGLITSEVERFLQDTHDHKRLILLDGLEYLIAQNGFRKVLKLLNHLKDTMGVHGATMLIPFDMDSVDEKEAAMLKADLELV